MMDMFNWEGGACAYAKLLMILRCWNALGTMFTSLKKQRLCLLGNRKGMHLFPWKYSAKALQGRFCSELNSAGSRLLVDCTWNGGCLRIQVLWSCRWQSELWIVWHCTWLPVENTAIVRCCSHPRSFFLSHKLPLLKTCLQLFIRKVAEEASEFPSTNSFKRVDRQIWKKQETKCTQRVYIWALLSYAWREKRRAV